MYVFVSDKGWESRDVFLRYNFCFPVFRRRFCEKEPGGFIGGEGGR